jgi:EmrB/QacA subfamily drug resistance transporter
VAVDRQARFAPTFAVVAAGIAMVNLDLFVCNVALPSIGRAFHGAGLGDLSWVLNAYAIIFAALLVPAGRAADRIGRRTAFLAGVIVFALASAACAFATGVWMLVAARVIQAAGGALLMPASLGLLLSVAPPARRAAAIRGWTAIGGVAAALGPVVGGLLVEASWRWVFLINVPVAAVTLVAGLRALPRASATAAEREGPRPDIAGAVVLTAAVGVLALALVKADSWGWSSARVLGLIAAAVVLGAAFAYRSARHAAPVIELHLLRRPAFGTATAASVLFGTAFGAMLLLVTLWCQDVWGWSALRAGLAVAPGPLMVPFLAVGAGPLARRVGPGPVAALGCAVYAGGCVFWRLSLELTPDYPAHMLPGMLMTGIGVGLTLPTLVSAAVSAVPPARFATGSGIVTMARQLGIVLGVAVLVTVLGAPVGSGSASGARALAAFGHGFVLIGALAATAGLASLLLVASRRRATVAAIATSVAGTTVPGTTAAVPGAGRDPVVTGESSGAWAPNQLRFVFPALDGTGFPASTATRMASLRRAEPARDVQPERLAGDHRPQAGLQLIDAPATEGGRPPGVDVLEDHRGQRQRLDPAGGEADELAAAVGGIAGPRRIAGRLQALDGLAGRLLGDAQPPADLAGGRPPRPDGLHREAVRGAHVRVAAPAQLGVQLIDDRPEPAEQQQRQLVPGSRLSRARACHNRQPHLLSRQQGCLSSYGELPMFTAHTIESAPAASRRFMTATQGHLGYLPAATARWAASPQLLDGFGRLTALFDATTLGPVAREVLIMTVATRNRCHLCVAMHTARLTTLGAGSALTAALRGGPDQPLADPRLEAIRVFTLRVLDSAGDVGEEALAEFLALGYTRQNALEVVLGIGAYTMSTLANRLTRAPVDPQLSQFA